MTTMRKKILKTGLAAMALTLAGSASAAKYLFTYSGMVTGSSVTGGSLFGATGNGLDNKRFTASITFDDATPGTTQGYPNSKTQSQVVGFDAADPTIGALTINGVSYLRPNPVGSESGSFGAYELYNNFNSAQDSINIFTASQGSTGTVATDYLFRRADFSGALSTLTNLSMITSLNLSSLPGFSYTAAGTNFAGGSFLVAEVQYRNNRLIRDTKAKGTFAIDLFTVSLVGNSVPAVPEPATWGMMVLGFGIVGSAMRRRRFAIARLA